MGAPAYIKLHQDGTLAARIETALQALQACTLCPRSCGVNRTQGDLGYCKTGRLASVASFGPHFGEEAPLVASHGSGTIFFTGCNLMCSFCQNYDISHLHDGQTTTAQDLAGMMLELCRSGCHNINFVTPSHVIPQILEALPLAIEQGLNIPLVYNSGGYDSISSLKLLSGVFDIYMPDFKFWDSAWSDKFCHAPDYPQVARSALKEMHAQVGDLQIKEGIAVRGLLLRHLVMPNDVAGTQGIMEYVAREISFDTYVNVMMQYRPCFQALGDATIGRGVTIDEYTQALHTTLQAGLHRLDKYS